MSKLKPPAAPAAEQTPPASDIPPPPAAAKSGRPRGPNKPKQPEWFKATFSDGTYRMLEDDDIAAVYARIATIVPARFEDAAQAQADGVKLESKPTPPSAPTQ